MTVFVFVGSLLVLMALGMPVAFALIGCGITMMFTMGLTEPQIVIQNMWDGANSFPLLGVPFGLADHGRGHSVAVGGKGGAVHGQQDADDLCADDAVVCVSTATGRTQSFSATEIQLRRIRLSR